jgi:tetratricopeptide (TPR) repeat protein
LAQAGILQRSGTASGYAESAELYESIFDRVPEYRQEPQLLYPLALSCYMVDRLDKAESYFNRCRAEPLGASMSAGVLFYLGEIRRGQGRSAEAGEFYHEALKVAPPDSPLREQLKQRLQ